VAALKVMRPKQWTKNGLLAAALVFSGQFLDPQRVGRAVLAVVAFNLLSSSGLVRGHQRLLRNVLLSGSA
jgi:hypothetical protein